VPYYEDPGVRNATLNITDQFGTQNNIFAENAVSVLEISAIDFINTTFSVTLSPGQSNISSTPITVKNTGNKAFSDMNITAFDLFGTYDVSKKLNASNFRAGVNLSSSVQLGHNSSSATSFTLAYGPSSYQSYYLWVTMPNNQYRQIYATITPWNLVVS
jgi:hypothetical protein